MNISCYSETAPIQTLLLKHPKDGFVDQENINRQWQQLHYPAPPDFQKACAGGPTCLTRPLLRKQAVGV